MLQQCRQHELENSAELLDGASNSAEELHGSPCCHSPPECLRDHRAHLYDTGASGEVFVAFRKQLATRSGHASRNVPEEAQYGEGDGDIAATVV